MYALAVVGNLGCACVLFSVAYICTYICHCMVDCYVVIHNSIYHYVIILYSINLMIIGLHYVCMYLSVYLVGGCVWMCTTCYSDDIISTSYMCYTSASRGTP